MNLYYATTKPNKVITLQREFAPERVKVIRASIDIPEPRSSDVQEIAKTKIIYAYRQLQKPVVALDAGFYIPSLNGFPRAFVNFVLETVNIEGILKLVQGKNRDCEFRDCLAYLDGALKEPQYFLSHTKGIISDEPLGEMHEHLLSKLGLIFIPELSKKTLAEMTQEEYLDWRRTYREANSCHRQFAKWLTQYKNL